MEECCIAIFLATGVNLLHMYFFNYLNINIIFLHFYLAKFYFCLVFVQAQIVTH